MQRKEIKNDKNEEGEREKSELVYNQYFLSNLHIKLKCVRTGYNIFLFIFFFFFVLSEVIAQ